MTRFKLCKYAGGSRCIKHGGDGSNLHKSGYIHPFPTQCELGKSANTEQSVLDKQRRTLSIPALEEFFDDQFAKSLLSVSIDEATSSDAALKKSLYDFDLNTVDGIKKILKVFPILDERIVRELAMEIWPGYPVDEDNARLVREEVKGYFFDYLEFLDGEIPNYAESSELD